MINCLYCGHETNADVNHYQGSPASVCKSTFENRVNCKQDWQNFKIRLEKYKESKYPEVREFAYRVELEVYDNKKPAIDWNRQLMSVRKLQKKLPMIKEIQK